MKGIQQQMLLSFPKMHVLHHAEKRLVIGR
jgi:hypothetical protein